MLKKKIPVIVVILSVLLGACQANQSTVHSETPAAYPAPGDMSDVQEPAYPSPQDMPIAQETIYPYPVTGDEPASSPLEPTFAPQAGDENLATGTVYPDLKASEILLLESYPVQVNLVLRGDLPTPCNQLRVKVAEPDAENRIQVEAYSVLDPNSICTQVLEPFEAQVALGSFTSGKYTVYVNGKFLGEFTI